MPRSERQAAELGGKIGLLRTAAARTGWIARLRHEAFDHAMEDDAVVGENLRANFDARHVAGRDIRAQLDHDAAVIELRYRAGSRDRPGWACASAVTAAKANRIAAAKIRNRRITRLSGLPETRGIMVSVRKACNAGLWARRCGGNCVSSAS